MQAQVGAVFTTFVVPLGSAPQTQLLRLTRHCWNVELQRASDARVTGCVLRPPPLFVDGVMYTGVVVSVAVSGAVDMVNSGSVAAALAMARRLRRLLCACLRSNSGDVDEDSVYMDGDNDDGKGSCWAVALEEERRLRAYVRCDDVDVLPDARSAVDAVNILHTHNLLTAYNNNNNNRRRHSRAAPRVVFFNAVLSPVAHELRRLRVRLRLHTHADDTWDTQPGHAQRSRHALHTTIATTTRGATAAATKSLTRQGAMLLTCDAVLRWLRRVLDENDGGDAQQQQQQQHSAHDDHHDVDNDDDDDDVVVEHDTRREHNDDAAARSTTTATSRRRPGPLPLQPMRRLGHGRAFVQHTRARVRACAVAHSMHRLTTQVGVQLTLQWRVDQCNNNNNTGGSKGVAAATTMEQHDTDVPAHGVALSTAPPSPAVTAAATATAALLPQHDDDDDNDNDVALSRRVEKVTCTIFATGNINVTAASMRALRSVTARLLLPLMLCCARLS